MKFANGDYPLEMFLNVGPEQYATPGTWDKIKRLIKLAKERYGWNVYVTPGANIYRWRAKQVEAKNDAIAKGRPNDAATVGDSSHGINWRGMEVLAVDMSGYDSNRINEWYALAVEVGLEPGYFSWEPWHLIDRDPWRIVVATTIVKDDKMEMVIKAPNGTVVHFGPRGKTNMDSSTYKTWSIQSNDIRKAGGTTNMELPAFEKLVNVSWATYNFICDLFKVARD